MNQVLESEVLCVVLEHQTLQPPQKRAQQFRCSLRTLLKPWHTQSQEQLDSPQTTHCRWGRYALKCLGAHVPIFGYHIPNTYNNLGVICPKTSLALDCPHLFSIPFNSVLTDHLCRSLWFKMDFGLLHQAAVGKVWWEVYTIAIVYFSNTYHTLSFHYSIQRAVLCSPHCSGEAICGMENTLAWTKKSTAQLCVSTQPWGSPLLSWSLYTSGRGRMAMPCRQGSFAQNLFESSYHINKC